MIFDRICSFFPLLDMSINSSCPSNESLLDLQTTSVSSYIPPFLHCLFSRQDSFIYTSAAINNVILLLPLSIFILYHGLQKWQQKRSTCSAATISHSDSFTYHMVMIELIGVSGCILICYGIYTKDSRMIVLGYFLIYFNWFGQIFFHTLTCMERYLAVVHPIIYLSLKNERGIQIRNTSIGCAWLVCFVGIGLVMIQHFPIILDLAISLISLCIVSFCSISVLCVLFRPGPGAQGGNRERVDQSKQKAFYTIVAILGVLMLRFTFSLTWALLYVVEENNNCMMLMFEIWINLPSSLVLPLLFLHRAGKLLCCKNNAQ